jgi:hypothetical protein
MCARTCFNTYLDHSAPKAAQQFKSPSAAGPSQYERAAHRLLKRYHNRVALNRTHSTRCLTDHPAASHSGTAVFGTEWLAVLHSAASLVEKPRYWTFRVYGVADQIDLPCSMPHGASYPLHEFATPTPRSC